MLNINHAPVQQESAVEQMLRRIKGEFLEMPGLRLTCCQAQRLWNLDAVVCEALLAALVDVRFLVEADGIYICTGATRLQGARAVTARSA